ncbi:MAG: proline--tRNA ligase [Candidatus Aenigmarchaeota archaeon]|nr:proline--tRNA ligase [Candidatus Aenigmarchaeota archaeon]
MSKQEGIAIKKSENFDEWYVQVILKSGLADYSAVSGCLVYRPLSYGIWEIIQKVADEEFKKIGVKNVYFPLLIPERLLKKEAEHVEGFTPEVAWVTQTGDTKLDERLAIRPTSETIMYDSYSKWIRSWRDLPVRLNQWNSVLRWEFKHPVPFLRTREFLWNEGHTAFATREEAEKEKKEILDIYQRITQEFLALPGIVGKKTEKEKFAGAIESYSIEHLLPDGKAIQGPDFHYDGQNFAKAFDISFLDKNGKKQYAWQNTWAITTREIGVMVAVHGDDKGLVLPPKVAPTQVVIVPIFDDKTKASVLKVAKKIKDSLKDVRIMLDDRDYYTPGWKFNEWELKGVPIRIEIGPRDIKGKKVVLVRRDDLKKRAVPIKKLEKEVLKELEDMQKSMLKKASDFLEANTRTANDFAELKSIIGKKGGFVQAGWCTKRKCEDKIKELTGAKITNMPLKQKPMGKCVYCGEKAEVIVNFAKSY